MDINSNIKLDGNHKTVKNPERIRRGTARVFLYDRNKYCINFNAEDSAIVSKFKFARCVFMSDSELFILVLTNDKDVIGEKYYKVCYYNKNNYQINGSRLIKQLAQQLDLPEGASTVSIGRNISKTDDKAVYVISKLK